MFKIYARGKAIGETIEEHDDITLFYILGQQWVGLVDNNPPTLRTDAGNVRPPPPGIYDRAWGVVFELWLR